MNKVICIIKINIVTGGWAKSMMAFALAGMAHESLYIFQFIVAGFFLLPLPPFSAIWF
jgi:hypothetical protein